MLKHGWIAWGVMALAVSGGPARADEPAPEGTEAAAGGDTNDSCASCGERGSCISRLVAFLSFCPEKAKPCCSGECERCPPPLYTFFPCTGCGSGGTTGCSACGGPRGRVLRFNKPAGACSNQCGGCGPTGDGNGRCRRLTTFCPSVIKADMPCLPPSRFHQGCCGCGAGNSPAVAGGCSTCSTFVPPTPVIIPAPIPVVPQPMPTAPPPPAPVAPE